MVDLSPDELCKDYEDYAKREYYRGNIPVTYDKFRLWAKKASPLQFSSRWWVREDGHPKADINDTTLLLCGLGL